MAGFVIEPRVRPCYVTERVYKKRGSTDFEKVEKRGLCHGLYQCSDVIPPSPLRGGHHGGCISGPVAIVEFEDGTLVRVNIDDIRFLDNIFQNYAFPEKEA